MAALDFSDLFIDDEVEERTAVTKQSSATDNSALNFTDLFEDDEPTETDTVERNVATSLNIFGDQRTISPN